MKRIRVIVINGCVEDVVTLTDEEVARVEALFADEPWVTGQVVTPDHIEENLFKVLATVEQGIDLWK